MTAPTDLFRRLVDDVVNGGDLDLLNELCTPFLAPRLRRAFGAFRSAFPDWQQEVREFVTDGHTVVARMRCTGTHHGEWQGLAPTGRGMRVDEVYFFRIAAIASPVCGAWKTHGPVCVNSLATTPPSESLAGWANTDGHCEPSDVSPVDRDVW